MYSPVLTSYAASAGAGVIVAKFGSPAAKLDLDLTLELTDFNDWTETARECLLAQTPWPPGLFSASCR